MGKERKGRDRDAASKRITRITNPPTAENLAKAYGSRLLPQQHGLPADDGTERTLPGWAGNED